jgi:hypothetical protein
MKVIAKVAGFFGVWREPGDNFQIDGPHQLGSWMEVVEGQKRRGRPPKDETKAEESPSPVAEVNSDDSVL